MQSRRTPVRSTAQRRVFNNMTIGFDACNGENLDAFACTALLREGVEL